MGCLKEQILIVYSVKKTPEEDLINAEKTINNYKLENSTVKTIAKRFEIPKGSSAGKTLTNELYKELLISVGALVFVDDLKPNVAYELGFFHGQNRTVLLITRKRIEKIWIGISDIAGTALANLNNETIQDAIKSYLDRIYTELSVKDPFDIFHYPLSESNQIEHLTKNISQDNLISTEFGSGFTIKTWKGIEINIDKNLYDCARFTILLRAKNLYSKYSIYFQVQFTNHLGEKCSIWIGVSSVKAKMNIKSEERLIPSLDTTTNWSILHGTFSDLFKKGHILGEIHFRHLDKIKIRSGNKEQTDSEIEIGYINITGIE